MSQIASGPSALPDLPPRTQQLLHDPVGVYAAGLEATTQAAVRRSLRRVARLVEVADPAGIPWEHLRYAHYALIRGKLLAYRKDPDDSRSGLSPATINLTLAHLRGVARAVWSLGYMTAEDWERVKDATKPVSGETLPAGREAQTGELAALLEACSADTTAAGARDAGMIALLYGAGLRRAELAALRVEDYIPETGELKVRRGKGRKDRLAYARGGAQRALDDWLGIRGREPGALFVPVNRGGRIRELRALDAQAIYAALGKRVEQAKLAQGLSPHDMRRSFISHLLDRGADIVTVQQLAGHADVSTTARYDRRGERAKRQAAELLHVPYAGRRDVR